MSLPSKTLCINPEKLNDKKNNKVINQLSKVIDIPYSKLKRIINKHSDKKEYYLKRHVSKDIYLDVSKISSEYIYFINENKRSYLGGEAFSNVLGFTDVDDNGQEGIELVKNKMLSPSDGIKKIKKDNIGRLIETIEVIKKPKPGNNLKLTLDKRIQMVAYDVLKKYVNKSNAESGSIVLVETSSGNILSMANYPSFDPEKRHTFKGDKIKNKVIHDLIEPGSTIKPIIIYAGLESKVIDKATIIETAPGILKLDNKEIKDWKYLGDVTAEDIIKLSSNIGAAKVSNKLSSKQLINTLDSFGFGQSLFLNLPGAKNGSIPSSNNLRISKHLSIGYGYGLSVSLMHLVNAYVTLANYGSHTQLKYVIVDEKYSENKQQILNKENAINVLDMMKEVVHSPDGTGKKARVNGYTIYGKTGTVRQIKDGSYDKNTHNALFIGILGDPKPKYVAAVIIREPKDREGSGGFHAAPVFSEFLQHSMRIIDNINYAGSK